jgi:6-phosphogluconolactonase
MSSPAKLTAPTTGIAIDPREKFVYASGPAGIEAYSISPFGDLDPPITGSPFAGAAGNFMTIDPAGKFLFAANSGASTISVYSIDPNNGALTPVAGSPFATGKSPRSIAIAPSGKFAYIANIGGPSDNGSISEYSIDATTGVLTQLAGSPIMKGDFPASIAVDRTGKFAYVGSDVIRVFGIDATTGALTEIAGSPFATNSYVTSLVVTP